MAGTISLLDLPLRFETARRRRSGWEQHWRGCYDHTLPRRNQFGEAATPGGEQHARIFDSTAPDAVERLAASLLAELTPPWGRWFGLVPGDDVPAEESLLLQPVLDRASEVLQGHLDRSNFSVEMHQAFLDLVIGGTGCLLAETSDNGGASALHFTAVPLSQLYLGENGRETTDHVFRLTERSLDELRQRFPDADLSDLTGAQDKRFPVAEAVWPEGGGAQGYRAWLAQAPGGAATALAAGRFDGPPFICFRWLKAPGEVYGRSPVMKVLADVKTANKVVELILKNASIAVTGIWQAEDDGVLNPANIQLKPGSIIPKAAGSAGLTPLAAPGRFDVSELVLDDLRNRIRSGLLADSLSQVDAPGMTATEVLTRSADLMRLLGATYGRLQSELLEPLLRRTYGLLARRGLVPPLALDGRMVRIDHRAPLARHQRRMEASALGDWLDQTDRIGPEARLVLDPDRAARWLANRYGVPSDVLAPPPVSFIADQEPM